MPFSQTNLNALIQTSAFNLWHYRTADSRATVTATNYFVSVASMLRTGDLMLVQASDAFALLPVRSGTVLGTGVTLDGAITPLRLARTAAQRFPTRQVATAVVRSLVLAPLVVGLAVGTALPVSAQVTGPVSQVVFSLRDTTGAVVPPVQVASVNGGVASATLTTPPIGGGWRIRVEDAADPQVFALSPSFSVTSDFRLLLAESAAYLTTEAGASLRL